MISFDTDIFSEIDEQNIKVPDATHHHLLLQCCLVDDTPQRTICHAFFPSFDEEIDCLFMGGLFYSIFAPFFHIL